MSDKEGVPRTSDAAALYRLMAWLSPAYPVGAFSYSSGIEWAVEAGDVSDATTLLRWLTTMIGNGGGFCDATLLVHAYRATAANDDQALKDVAELAAAFAPSKERFLETTAQGRAFIDATQAAWPCVALSRLMATWEGPLAYPVAVGMAAAGHDIPLGGRPHRVPACGRRQPRVRGRPPDPARPDRRPARARLARAGDRHHREPRARRRARRHRRRRFPRRHRQHAPRTTVHTTVQELTMQTSPHGPLRVGVGGPVGSGKTALMDALCKRLRDRFELAAITNDIYTKWDAEYLVRSGALSPDRIAGVETGGCPHTAIREDASANLAAVADMRAEIPRSRSDPDRIRRRQSRGDVLARARRPHDLRDRRRRRREDPLQGRPRHHALRSAGHQQDRPRAACRRVARGDGARRQAHARRAAVRVQQSADRPRRSTRSRNSSRPRAGSAKFSFSKSPCPALAGRASTALPGMKPWIAG